MKKLWLFFRPDFIKSTLLLLLMILVTLAVTERNATSKVSWQEKRGAPFYFVTISGYEGPCSENAFCRDVNIQSFNLWALMVDVAGWYLISCAIVFGYEILKKQHRQRLLEP
jgi:hypothetical protein